MRCALCGYEYDGADGSATCRGCPMAGACHMVRCPNCGYEVPLAPEMKRAKSLLKGLFGRRTTTRQPRSDLKSGLGS